jgi:hypothetical protein
MLAQLTAFEVVALTLFVCFVAGLFGWAGGAGARLSFAVRLSRVESYVLQVLNRAKGAAGQAQTQVFRERKHSADAEAEALAARLARQPALVRKPPSEWTEEDMEREARRRGLVAKGGDG